MTLQKYLAMSACALSLGTVLQPNDASAGKKPNIIVILADDYGKDAASIYNPTTDLGKTAPTPSLATLADKGVQFNQAWAMPACSVTRGTRSTGKLPSTSGMGWVIGRFTPRFGASGSRFAGVEFPPTMINPGDPDLIQRRAKNAGYRTYKLGKWHEVASTPPPTPPSSQDVLNSGFDVFYGQLGGAPGPLPPVPGQGGYGGDNTWTPVNSLGLGATKEFLPSALVSRAIEFVDEAEGAGDPYYIALDFYAPHFPYEVAPGPGEPAPADNPDDFRTLNTTDHAGVIAQVEAAFGGTYPAAGTPVVGGPPTPAQQAQARAAFKSLISYMDVQIGRLMEHVDLKNTIVFFAGDNGTQGAGFAPSFNAVEPPNDPTKSKVTLYRNGVEIPFIVAGAGVRKGKKTNALVNTADIYATALKIMGQRQPKATRRDSKGFNNVLRGGRRARSVNVAEQFVPTATVGGTGTPNTAPDQGRVVASTNYRLIARPVIENNAYVCNDGSAQDPANDCLNDATGVYEKKIALEFFDIKADPSETNALTTPEMNRQQLRGFRRMCRELNRISNRATFFQNGQDCKPDGSNLIDPDDVV